MIFTPLILLSAAIGAIATPVPAPAPVAEANNNEVVSSLVERQSTCTAYTIINTRGTGEPQGPSSGFTTMNRNILSQVRGGSVYSTVYAAGFSQNSAAGTTDILRQIDSTLARDPNHCFILQGYSQGAAATVNAIDRIQQNEPRFKAVRGVFLIGSPLHRAGLACNVDTEGGTRTLNVNGISRLQGRIPERWVAKSLDVCNFGDGVCDTTNGRGINAAHLVYPRSAGTQRQGTEFAVARLTGAA